MAQQPPQAVLRALSRSRAWCAAVHNDERAVKLAMLARRGRQRSSSQDRPGPLSPLHGECETTPDEPSDRPRPKKHCCCSDQIIVCVVCNPESSIVGGTTLNLADSQI